ncbi:uncharacterized protein LOC128997682 isoform X7 [Macrosteles quadrilineatus]|uniref:uncharacterized protein LOC128996817 isoform X6 n=1 Tax=Macrosteles quadrilineatus TaxID=74068 RepID=UPI0023E23678|nr:uncharacterized protein LOC128996817 isoform X6 [Macrosteles quadrilineatus]XP_054279310.1 uncharacterized protein LOC128997682 isoform X7 [Macrosteles quadrilineatus]
MHICVAISAIIYVLLACAEARLIREYDVEDSLEDDFSRNRRSEEEIATPWLGLGVLSDMQQFFDNLRTNLDSLESLPPEQRDALLGNSPQPEKDQYFRPSATAAYLHAMRNQRPSYKIRNFVESPEPATLRGTNHYDPSLLWTGLGRRRR